MDEQELAKLLKGAGEDPAYIIGTSSTLNADGTVTITGGGRSVNAIAQTAFRSGTWSAKRVGNTWYAWSGSAPIDQAVSTNTRRSKAPAPKTKSGLIKVLFSIKKGDERSFYVGGDRETPKKIFSLPWSYDIAGVHLQNTGENPRNWLFSIAYPTGGNYSDNTSTDALITTGSPLTVKTISPKGQNWEVMNAPSRLSYRLGGVWRGQTPIPPIAPVTRGNTVSMEATPGGLTAWDSHNYQTPLNLISETVVINSGGSIPTEFYSYSVAIAMVALGEINFYRTRQYGDFNRNPVRFDNAPLPLLPEVERQEANTSFFPIMVDPTLRQVIYNKTVSLSFLNNLGQKWFLSENQDAPLNNSASLNLDVRLDNLVNENIYRVNYNYSPYSFWKAFGGNGANPTIPEYEKLRESKSVTKYEIVNSTLSDAQQIELKGYLFAISDDQTIEIHSFSYYSK